MGFGGADILESVNTDGGLLGAEIGGYVLERKLGEGASATVYLARDGAGHRVALKLLARGVDLGERDGDARERLRGEAKALRRITVPGVAEVLDWEVDAAEAFIVTEYIPGPTLAEDVRTSGAWNKEDVFELGTLLAQTLQAVHAAGICHRDIKPANVILGPNGPVLIDFGISAALDQSTGLTRTGLVVGTPGFISPEVISGKKADFSDDWWSLAALLLFALTARPPFGFGSPATALSRVLAGNPDVSGLDDNLAGVFRAVLAPLPERRADFEDLLTLLGNQEDPADAWPTQLLSSPHQDNLAQTRVIPTELNGRYINPAAVDPDTSGVLDPGTGQDAHDTADFDPENPNPNIVDDELDGKNDSESDAKPAPKMLPVLGMAAALAWAAWTPWSVVVLGLIASVGLWLAAIVGWQWRSRRKILSVPASIVKGLISVLPALAIVTAALAVDWEILNGDALSLPVGIPEWIPIFGTLVPKRVYVSQLLALGAILIAWWIPFTAPARLGARRTVRALLPTVVRRLILTLVFAGFIAAAFILV